MLELNIIGFHDAFRLDLRRFINKFKPAYLINNATEIIEIHAKPESVSDDFFKVSSWDELKNKTINIGLNKLMAQNVADFYYLDHEKIPCVTDEEIEIGVYASRRDKAIVDITRAKIIGLDGVVNLHCGSMHAIYAFDVFNKELDKVKHYDIKEQQAIINPDYADFRIKQLEMRNN